MLSSEDMPLSDLLLFLTLVFSSQLPTASLTGQVRTADGTPVPGVLVELRQGQRLLPATTDDLGRYRLVGLVPGPRRGALWLGGSTLPVTGRIAPGANRADFTLAGSVVRGRVLSPEGAPVAGAGLQLDWEEEGTSGADGTFTLLAPAGSHELLARQSGYTTAHHQLELAEGSLAECAIHLGRGAVLSGRLLGLTPDEILLATVQVERSRFEPRLAALVEDDGSYRLEGLPPGTLWVRAWAHGKHAKAQVTFAEGEERTQDLSLALVHVTGRAVDDQGRPVADCEIAFASAEEAGFTHTTGTGAFELELYPGLYSVSSMAEPNEEKELLETVEPVKVDLSPARDLELHFLPATGVIHGRLLGLTPEEESEAGIVAVRSNDRSLGDIASGRYEISRLAPGEWEVTATHGDVHVQAKVTVPLRGTADLDLAFPPR